MARVELKIELAQRYCPVCRVETQHTILFQFVGPDGRPSGRNDKKRPDAQTGGRLAGPVRGASVRPSGRKQPDELLSACAICNPDRFWALRFATAGDAQKLVEEGWTTRIGHSLP
ncbi:MAG: hypothetical protein ACE5MH_05735 [Terriglobia bacterium]